MKFCDCWCLKIVVIFLALSLSFLDSNAILESKIFGFTTQAGFIDMGESPRRRVTVAQLKLSHCRLRGGFCGAPQGTVRSCSR
ncbi:hypothetical protein MLD38_014745 [Melastoma candidum]|uniref:Uncharacterized protein n=1 Tax=Melastoma candidum TaxID=119954 RepID=A0ACB9RDV6_9MYRT|nr:hypothetical protein MLD38_014745 [Melastoma candidum]